MSQTIARIIHTFDWSEYSLDELDDIDWEDADYARALANRIEAECSERGAAMERELSELRGLVDAYLAASPGDESEDAYWDLRRAVEHRRAVEKRLAPEVTADPT